MDSTRVVSLLGREQELAVMQQELRRVCDTGTPSVLALEADAGLGKSTLIQHFLELAQADEPNAKVAYGQSKARMSTSNGYQPMREALTNLAERASNRERLRAASGHLGEVLKATAPDWLNAVPAIGDLLVAAYTTYGAVGSMVKDDLADSVPRQFTNLVQQLLQTGPLVVALDDLHWADVSTIELLVSLVSDVQSGRLVLILAYRPSDVSQSPTDKAHPLRENLLHIERYHPIRRIPLTPLDVGVMKSIWQEHSSYPLNAEISDALNAICRGNPLYMHEFASLISHQIEDDMPPGRVAGLVKDHIEIPRRIEAVIEKRLLSLSDAERRVLELAAVLGTTFSPRDLIALADVSVHGAKDALRSLTRRHRLVRPGPHAPDPDYLFEHQTIHTVVEKIHREEDPFDYSDAHGRAAQLLLQRPETLNNSLHLAHHLRESGNADGAFHHATQAATLAYGISAYPEIWQILQEWLFTAEGEPGERLRAARLAMRSLTMTSHYAVAVQTWEQLEQEIGKDPECMLQAARAYRMCNKWDAALDLARSSVAVEGEAAVDAYIIQGEVALCRSNQDLNQAMWAFRQAEQRVSPSDNSRRARILGHIGLIQLASGAVRQALVSLDAAVAIAEASFEPFDDYEAVHWRCKAAIATLDLERARELLQRQEELSQASGTASAVPFHKRDLSRILCLGGYLHESARVFRDYAQTINDSADRLQLGRVYVNLGLQVFEARSVLGTESALEFSALVQGELQRMLPLARDVLRSAAYTGDVQVLLTSLDSTLASLGDVDFDVDGAEAIYRFDVPNFWEKRRDLSREG